MDLTDFWAENKRFCMSVLGGFIVFFIGLSVVNNTYWDPVKSLRVQAKKTDTKLKQERFDSGDKRRAKEQNEALEVSLAALAERVEFKARREFTPQEGSSVTNAYFGIASRVREDLLTRAGRSGMRLAEDLGLPASVVEDDQIVRYLEGLDIVERVVSLGLQAGVERVDEVRIRLDPALLGGKTLPRIEQTRVEFELSGFPGPLVKLITLCQDEGESNRQSLVMDQLEVKSVRAKQDQISVKLTFLACHLHGIGTEEGEEVQP